MILEFNKFNSILYFILGTTVTVAFKRFIYGGLILALCLFVIIQSFLINSGNPTFIMYQNYTKIPAYIMLIILILISLYILQKSSIKPAQKLFSIVFLILSILFSIFKNYFKDKEIFNLMISNYVGSLLFMISLVSISIIPDNQVILHNKYKELKNNN